MKKIILFLLILSLLVIGGWVFAVSTKGTTNPTPGEERCHPRNAPFQDATLPIEARIDDLLGRMTLEEKIGQLALVEKNGLQKTEDISTYHLGALLSGSGSRPATNTPLAWLEMVQDFQNQAKETCLGIPVLYGIDAVHGNAGVYGATVFPHAIGLAASHDANLVGRVAHATAEEMAATGIYWNFSPSLDVTTDQRWGRVYETFGSNTTTISDLGAAAIEGLQTSTEPYLNALATPKHFVGNGATTWRSSVNADYSLDQGNTELPEAALRRDHIEAFKHAIDVGALSIMAGLNSWQGTPIAAQRHLLTDVLKHDLGFQGFVVSDWYGVYAISKDRYTATVTGINAGIDMVMLPFDYQLFATDMQQAIAAGDISQDRLNDAVRRILRAKFRVGLFDRPAASENGLATIGSTEHRALAREAVQKSLTVLKTKPGVLPLSKNGQRILVAGSGADNLGIQAGGWTLEWQGVDGNLFPGTTILNGIQNTVGPNTAIEYAIDGGLPSQVDKADVGIVVVGERPYAEGVGDRANPEFSKEDLKAIANVRARSKKLIVIVLSGRALEFPEEAKGWDTIIAAWLPGSEGRGVADGLFGVSPLVATTPVSWKIPD